MGMCCNPPDERAKRRARAESVLRQRAEWPGKSGVGGQWSDMACSPGCPGWDVFETDKGFGIEACDECNIGAKEAGLPRLFDKEAKELPAAQRLHRRHIAEYGSSHQARDYSEPVENPTSPSQRFTELLRDDDPNAMNVAEDVLLEHGLTLREMGGGLRARNITFEMKPMHGPREEWKMVQTSVDRAQGQSPHPSSNWVKITAANGAARFEHVYYLNGMTLDDARMRAAGIAWQVAKAIKPLPMDASEDELDKVCHQAITKASSDPEGRRDGGHPPQINPRSVLTGPRWDSARAKLASSAAKKNPSPPKAAIDKYEEFHRFKPVKIGEFKSNFQIPRSVLLAGVAKWTTYRSGKVDPSTLEKPKKPVNYIHEHDAGVNVYLASNSENAAMLDGGESVTVPAQFRGVDALVCLGDSLGFCFERDGEECEAEGTAPLPELYCTPDGKCLYVIQGKSEVMAMIWGGGLGVFARGIDG